MQILPTNIIVCMQILPANIIIRMQIFDHIIPDSEVGAGSAGRQRGICK